MINQKQTNMKLKMIPLALTIVFTCTSAISQPVPESQKKYGGLGYFAVGYSSLNVNDLNASLVSFGYPEVSNNMVSFGGGGHGMMGRWMFGGHGHSLYGPREDYETYELGLAMGYGFVNLGYAAFSSQTIDVIPMLGIGSGGMTLDIEWDEPTDFEELLDDPQKSTKITKDGFLLEVGVTTTFLLNTSDNPLNRGGLAIGIQAGWVLDPFENEWTINDNDVDNSPDLGMGGPYIRLLIGGGGFNYPEILD